MSLAARSLAGTRVRSRTVANRAGARAGAVNAQARDAAWAPGAEAPAHLDGSLPGDFGFDPLGLGVDPEALKWYQQAELVHARFAMLATAGILIPEVVASTGFSWPGAGVPWYEAGKFEYFAPTGSVFITQLALMGWAETRRYQDIKTPGSVNQDPLFEGNSLPEGPVGYPGGIFDPFGWSKGDVATLKLKEIKNGRIAMMAMLGYYVQAQVVGGTPLSNWTEHLANPWSTTILSKMPDTFVWRWTDPSFLGAVAPIKSLPAL